MRDMTDRLSKILGKNCFLINNNKVAELANGRHYLGKGIFVNIEEYSTFERSECRFEVHKKYVDVQYIISGCEKIVVQNFANCYGNEQWDYDKDIVFIDDNGCGDEIIVGEGEYITLFPQDAHMPCIKTGNSSEKIRKAVFKIPYSLFKNIKYLLMDVDGTLTDGKIYMGPKGEEFKVFDIKDGFGINEILPLNKIIPIVITGRESEIVENRCQELHITEVYQGIKNKREVLEKILSEKKIETNTVAYIGDDINDIECMQLIKQAGGLTACPLNSSREVRAVVDYVCSNIGGNGAVREFIEWLTV